MHLEEFSKLLQGLHNYFRKKAVWTLACSLSALRDESSSIYPATEANCGHNEMAFEKIASLNSGDIISLNRLQGVWKGVMKLLSQLHASEKELEDLTEKFTSDPKISMSPVDKMVEEFEKELGMSIPLIMVGRRPGNAEVVYASIDKAKSKMNRKSKSNIKEGASIHILELYNKAKDNMEKGM
ncbi:hypothetical protein Tco_1001201 [Tanacetum coccineum]